MQAGMIFASRVRRFRCNDNDLAFGNRKLMAIENKRAEQRVPVNYRGTLMLEDASFPCLVEDMSKGGILVMSSRELPVGQVLGFKCELFPLDTQASFLSRVCPRYALPSLR